MAAAETLRLPALPVPDATTENGRRMLFVGIVNHGNAEAAQKALDSAVDWVYLTEAAKLKALTR